MRESAFDRAESLLTLGLDHGLGTLASEAAAPGDLVLARQVHGRRIAIVPPSGSGTEADALLSTIAGTAVGVCTADCVPILLAAPGGRGVAAVHAGWRGSAARIAEHAVGELAREVDVRPEELFAAVGPHIGACCYEVDDPVRSAIAEDEVFVSTRPGHYRLDLLALTRLQLEHAGVRSDRVEHVGACTACDAERYASFRRDGTGRRMVHYIRVAE